MDIVIIARILYLAVSSGTLFGTVFVWPFFRKNKVDKNFKFQLQRISKYDGFLINKESLSNHETLKDWEESLKREELEGIRPSIERVVEYIGEERLALMFTNLKNIKVYKQKWRIFFNGSYDIIKNVLKYGKEWAIVHELLHMATSYYDEEKGIIESGFSQHNLKDKTEIGIGLDEGYTELLSSRIRNGRTHNYSFLILVSELFELFFDDPKTMESFYLNHDLPGFIHYMEKFMPYDNIISVLLLLDKICSYQVEAVATLAITDLVAIEEELYKYFMMSNPSVERQEKFLKIVKKKKISSTIFNREKDEIMEEVTTLR